MFNDAHLSTNIQIAPDVYEVENAAADPERRIETAMRNIHPWEGKIVLDLGAGTGYHLARFHQSAAHVIGVEPDDASRLRAMARASAEGLLRTSILTGSAEHVPLRDHSVDIVHARFAYFFGPGSEKGIDEVGRVMRPGGTAFIIDNDLGSGTFASWLRRSQWVPSAEADVVEQFWREHGFALTRIESMWRFRCWEDFEAVIRLEFPASLANEILAEHQGLIVECHYNLYSRTF